MNKRTSVLMGLSVMSATMVLAVRTSTLPAQEPNIVQGQVRTGPSAEDAIRETLGKTCQIDFVETPLQDVAEYVAETFDIGVIIDSRALDLVGIGGDTPVTIKVRNVSLKSALALMLEPLELTWIIQHEVLKITTPEDADLNMSTRVYEVRDLVLPDPARSVARPLVFGGGGSDEVDFDSLIETITSIVDPETWDEVGGPGSVSPLQYSGNYVLVVSQTEQTHERIEALLQSLRAVKSKPDADAKAAAADQAADDAKIYVQVYPIARDARSLPADLEALVTSALPDAGWDETEGPFVRGIAETVVVKHNRGVQRQVRKLLEGVGAVSTFGLGGSGGFGGGGALGVIGGQEFGGGSFGSASGFFQVESEPPSAN